MPEKTVTPPNLDKNRSLLVDSLKEPVPAPGKGDSGLRMQNVSDLPKKTNPVRKAKP